MVVYFFALTVSLEVPSHNGYVKTALVVPCASYLTRSSPCCRCSCCYCCYCCYRHRWHCDDNNTINPLTCLFTYLPPVDCNWVGVLLLLLLLIDIARIINWFTVVEYRHWIWVQVKAKVPKQIWIDLDTNWSIKCLFGSR